MNNLFISPQGEYPRFYGDVQLDDPTYELGGTLPAGWIEVQEIEPPVAGIDEIVEPTDPVEIDGVWTQQWNVRSLTAEEIERRDAPKTAKAKLVALGLSEVEIQALVSGLVR